MVEEGAKNKVDELGKEESAVAAEAPESENALVTEPGCAVFVIEGRGGVGGRAEEGAVVGERKDAENGGRT